jgi:hypothetical protein
MTAVGNHVIQDSGSGFSGCSTPSSTTLMTHSTAVTQGYMASGTGTSGNNSNVTCANDLSPCAATSSSAATTTAAAPNEQSYCTAMQGSSDPMIVNAGKACQNGTTDACSYNTSNHSVSCGLQQAVTHRPTSGTWNSGAYQYSGLAAPTNLNATP